MAETLSLRGTLEGHSGWVTSIATPLDPHSDLIGSASRGVTFFFVAAPPPPCAVPPPAPATVAWRTVVPANRVWRGMGCAHS